MSCFFNNFRRRLIGRHCEKRQHSCRQLSGSRKQGCYILYLFLSCYILYLFLSCYIFHHFCVLGNRLDPNTGIQMDAHFRHFWFSIRMSFEYGPFMIMWTKSVLNVLKPDRTLHNFTIWQQSIMWIWQILANSSTTLHFSKITWYLGFI